MKKLYRSKERKLSGVCGGVGNYFDTDPSLIRLAWIVMTILTGIIPGVVAYFVAAIVIPSEESADSTVAR